MNTKRNIVIDIGNSRIKSGLFENDNLLDNATWDSLMSLTQYCQDTRHDKIAIVSVRHSKEAIQQAFHQLEPIIIDRHTKLPISIDYKTPDTLGLDRLVSALGGISIFPNKDLLIIDMGTCITYDIVDATGTFKGGIISPGLEMRMKSMSDYTQNLPDIRNNWSPIDNLPIGKSTKECLSIGSFNAIIHELNGFIEAFKGEYSEMVVILTGGNSSYFESKLKQPIFADSFLVLKGLNRILNQ